jgi:hypothetical protein
MRVSVLLRRISAKVFEFLAIDGKKKSVSVLAFAEWVRAISDDEKMRQEGRRRST